MNHRTEDIYFGYFTTVEKKYISVFPVIPEQNINISGFGCFFTGDKGDHIVSCK